MEEKCLCVFCPCVGKVPDPFTDLLLSFNESQSPGFISILHLHE